MTADSTENGKRGAKLIDLDRLSKLEVLDPREAAEYLRSSASTLAKMRIYGGGPSFVKQNARRVVYRRRDLDTWLAGKVVTSTSDRAA